jgi:hypothetical protein
MSEANEGRPLTRRQLRELERAAELARTGGTPPVADETERPQPTDAPIHLGRHSAPSVPAAPVSDETRPIVPLVEPPTGGEQARPLGRFFGRRKAAGADEQAEPAELSETVAMDRVDVGDGDDVIEAELQSPEAPRASVPAPWSARRSSVQIDDVQGLDTVDDAELEDRRRAEADDEPAPTGPRRGQSQRLPVIVNVVSDTSEHHIADLREQGVVTNGGSSTSSFTANALVLPAGTDNPDFQLEGEDGLLVTGSIDVPEGFASSGRGSASIDGSDVDADVADGEVTSPETAPVRASKAVSSYANARVQIAPQKQRPNMMPVAIGVGAGAFVAAVGGFLALALTQGWL